MKKSTKKIGGFLICGTQKENEAIKKAAKKLKTTPEGFLLYLADNFINSKTK